MIVIVTVNGCALGRLVPPLIVVAVMGPVTAPDGTVAVRDVSEITVKEASPVAAALWLNWTAVTTGPISCHVTPPSVTVPPEVSGQTGSVDIVVPATMQR